MILAQTTLLITFVSSMMLVIKLCHIKNMMKFLKLFCYAHMPACILHYMQCHTGGLEEAQNQEEYDNFFEEVFVELEHKVL